MTTSREMTTGPALPLILNFTLPLLLGNLLQQTFRWSTRPSWASFWGSTPWRA